MGLKSKYRLSQSQLVISPQIHVEDTNLVNIPLFTANAIARLKLVSPDLESIAPQTTPRVIQPRRDKIRFQFNKPSKGRSGPLRGQIKKEIEDVATIKSVEKILVGPARVLSDQHVKDVYGLTGRLTGGQVEDLSPSVISGRMFRIERIERKKEDEELTVIGPMTGCVQ